MPLRDPTIRRPPEPRSWVLLQQPPTSLLNQPPWYCNPFEYRNPPRTNPPPYAWPGNVRFSPVPQPVWEAMLPANSMSRTCYARNNASTEEFARVPWSTKGLSVQHHAREIQEPVESSGSTPQRVTKNKDFMEEFACEPWSTKGLAGQHHAKEIHEPVGSSGSTHQRVQPSQYSVEGSPTKPLPHEEPSEATSPFTIQHVLEQLLLQRPDGILLSRARSELVSLGFQVTSTDILDAILLAKGHQLSFAVRSGDIHVFIGPPTASPGYPSGSPNCASAHSGAI